MQLQNTFIGAEGVGPVTERTLWDNGIHHWDAFDGSSVGPKRADAIDRYIEEARTALADNDVGYFFDRLPSQSTWRCYPNFQGSICFLDIETTGLDRHRNQVTTVSLHQGGETRTLVRGQDLSWARLNAALESASIIVTFNGASFDIPFLETEFGKSIETAHLDLMHLCRRVDLTGGQDAIESKLGIERSLPDISGEDAVRLWHAYQRGDSSALDTLVTYNQADTENMKPILETAVDRLRESVVPSQLRETQVLEANS